MAIRTRTSDGYQQVELTSELLHSQSGATQQVISTVPCTKHLPFFLSILLADLCLFGAPLLLALWATQYGDGLGYSRPEVGAADQTQPASFRQLNLHALSMLVAMVYLNGQAITCYKSNYLVKHKSLNMLLHFLLHLLTVGGLLGGLYLAHQGQETQQAQRPRVSHLYSLHSWAGLAAALLFSLQYLFGFCTFFVTLCCRKLTARMRARALPIHRTLAMVVWATTAAAAISGLTQLARFQLGDANADGSRQPYRELGLATLLINLAGVCVLLATPLIFFITFIFKRRQAHDLPVLFKIILLVSQFVQLVLVLVLAEWLFQVVTPHVNKVISGQFLQNTTLTHIINNATHSIGTFISSATQQITGGGGSSQGSSAANSSIILGSSNGTL